MWPELLGEKVCIGSQRQASQRKWDQWALSTSGYGRGGRWNLEEEWLQQPVSKRAMSGGNGSGGLLLGSGP